MRNEKKSVFLPTTLKNVSVFTLILNPKLSFMKKLIIGMLALVMCLGMNSCKKEATTEGQKEGTEQAEAKGPALAEIVEKAKAEGANWTVDEWKEQFKNVMIAIKPMMVELNDVMKGMEGGEGEPDPAKVAEMMSKFEEVQKKYADVDSLMDAFSKIAEGCENGKAVSDDEEWGKKMMEELGIPDIDM